MALIQINQFKGLNESVDATLLNEESVIAHNSTLRDGTLKHTRKPLKLEGSNLQGIKTIMSYYKDGQPILMGATDTAVYKWDGSKWTSITTGKNGGVYDYINNNIDDKDIIVMSNGIDNIFKYDGTEVKELKMLGKDSDYSKKENRAPKGAYLGLHYERLWIANDNYLYCSSVTANGGFDIEDFTTPTEPEWEVNNHGAEIFMYSNDGTKIKGMAVVYDDILIFKERKIFRLYGTTPSNMQKVELFNSSGAIADKSIVSTPQGAFFVHKDGIYQYDGSNVSKISQKIDKIWDTIDKGKIDTAIAAFFDNKYILAVQRFGSDTKDLIIELDILTGNFTTRDGYSVESFVEFADELVFASSDGFLYRYNRGEADNLIWQGAELTIPDGSIEIEAIKLHTTGTGRLKVSVITEKKTKEKIVDIVKDGVKYISINNVGRGASIKIEQLEGNITIRKCYIEYDLDED